MKIILWLALITLLIVMGLQAGAIKNGTTARYTLFGLEFAGSGEGHEMLQSWKDSTYGGKALLELVRSNTHIDFLFLLIYTLLMMIHSNGQMQRERGRWLNAFLRLNLFVAVLTGLFDVTENLILLYDFRHVTDPGLYISSRWISGIKWALAGWVILIWLISAVHTASTRNQKQGYQLQ